MCWGVGEVRGDVRRGEGSEVSSESGDVGKCVGAPHPNTLPYTSPHPSRQHTSPFTPYTFPVARGFATWKIRHTMNVTENLSVSEGQMFATVPMWKIRHTTVIGWGRGVEVRGLGRGSWGRGVGVKGLWLGSGG